MGKSTEPPKCKVCGEPHRGPCFQRDSFVETSQAVVRKMVRSSLQSDAKDRGDHLVPSTGPEGTPVQDQSLPHPNTPRKRGRPATGFDKKVCGEPHRGPCYSRSDAFVAASKIAGKKLSEKMASMKTEGWPSADPLHVSLMTEDMSMHGRVTLPSGHKIDLLPGGGAVDVPAKRGRPSTGFDKKAHDREKAKERRDKLKAQRESK